jgi:hypothetical protein
MGLVSPSKEFRDDTTDFCQKVEAMLFLDRTHLRRCGAACHLSDKRFRSQRQTRERDAVQNVCENFANDPTKRMRTVSGLEFRLTATRLL